MNKDICRKTIIAVKRFVFVSSIILIAATWSHAQEFKTIKLDAPNKERGFSVMKALSVRASVHEWSDQRLSNRDLSDLLWAANGVNRPDGGRTAPSARNAYDIDIYVFTEEGIYLYDAPTHVLNPVVSGDYRDNLGKPAWAIAAAAAGSGVPPADSAGADTAGAAPVGGAGGAAGASKGVTTPPILLFLVSDITRFDGDGNTENKVEWATIDAGIVSQNVSLFCAATGLKTRPRGSFSKDDIRKILNLKETQYPLLNMPVGYAAD